MNIQIIGIVTALFGLAVITVSSIVLEDIIRHKNREWWVRWSPDRYRDDYFYDQFKFDDDILIILAPLTLLAGLVQFFIPALFCCLSKKDLKRMIQLWIGTKVILLIVILFCFALSLHYGIDTIGNKTYNYDGRYSHTYLSSWWKYKEGQAYLGVLGCDVFLLFGVIVWLVKWTIDYRKHSQANSQESLKMREGQNMRTDV